MALAVFDLDNTLLEGDTDVLWCEFLLARGRLGEEFRARSAEMDRRYREGAATPLDFAGFYVSTLAGLGHEEAAGLRDQFMAAVILPRIPARARALVAAHAGDTRVLSTATNRFLTEPTAEHLGIAHLIATDVGMADGRFTGHIDGTVNMREGKVHRMREWLASQGLGEDALRAATFYSDSINDLPLLAAVGTPVAVDPDPKLSAEAAARGWRVISLRI